LLCSDAMTLLHRRPALLVLFVPFACSDPGSGDAAAQSSEATSATTSSSSDAASSSSSSSSSSGATDAASSSAADSSSTSTGPSTDEGPLFDLGVVPDHQVTRAPPTDIAVVITADNAYAFGYGSQDEMSNYFGGVANLLASEIFACDVGPELYTV